MRSSHLRILLAGVIIAATGIMLLWQHKSPEDGAQGQSVPSPKPLWRDVTNGCSPELKPAEGQFLRVFLRRDGRVDLGLDPPLDPPRTQADVLSLLRDIHKTRQKQLLYLDADDSVDRQNFDAFFRAAVAALPTWTAWRITPQARGACIQLLGSLSQGAS